MKKLLGLLGTLGLVSTSATAVVSLVQAPRGNDAESKPIDKDVLIKLIGEARAMATDQKSKHPDAYKALHKAIGEADGVLIIYENETENPNVLSTAHKNLTSAMGIFSEFPDQLANIEMLRKRITDANTVLEAPVNQWKDQADKTRLQEAIAKAQKIIDGKPKSAEQNVVNTGVSDLQFATLKFFDATDAYANTDALVAEIAKAIEALKTPQADEAMDALRKEIKLAEDVRDAKYSSGEQNIVDAATERLKQAIEDYKNAGQPPIPPDDVDLTKLKDLIVTAKRIASDVNNQLKPLEERNKFEQAIGHAEGIIAGKPVITQKDKITAELKLLQTAIDNFGLVKNEKANKSMLQNNIDAAEKIDKTKKKPAAVGIFDTAIATAKAVNETNHDIDQQKVYDDAANAMWDATLTFLSSDNRININAQIYTGAKLTAVLADSKEATIKQQLEIQFPNVKEKIHYTITDIKVANNENKSSALITGVNDYRATAVVYFRLAIKNIEAQLTTIANKGTKLLTAAELKAEIENNKIDVINGLNVTEMSEGATSKTRKFEITANNRYGFSGYDGIVTITQTIK
ncbi:hypothetical protein ELUMI_v1c00810 [Williamsoniiplasma luminosum]|uniref:Uncharacterized protein n=1 Tax=Williamsoniiplasma luminosum TaxID=214888 RepID=A0A2K8NSN5_9MOLU|nr:lipoprotein [Williamsoniiplasma luminosum]ATZ16809.1 hypothetical protein ELUMI_v1c00810 [Williamsoniiplasma luminosum]